MKVFLQHKATQLYFQTADRWVSHVSEARDFQKSLEAIDYRLEHKVTDVEIVLKFPNPQYDIRLDPDIPSNA